MILGIRKKLHGFMRVANTYVYPRKWSCIKKHIEKAICLQLFMRIKLRYVELYTGRYCFLECVYFGLTVRTHR